MHQLEDYYCVSKSNSYLDRKAEGFSARVFQATSFLNGDEVAVKILRREHLEKRTVWDQFALEADLLLAMASNPSLVKMLDCGFVEDSDGEIPRDKHLVSLGLDAEKFASILPEYFENKWRPYITLELVDNQFNLLELARGVQGDHKYPLRLPTEEGLDLALQFTQFLREAHDQDIVYWDHKPEHAYWDGKQLRIIDMNVSRRLPAELSYKDKAKKKHDDLRGFIAFTLFTVFTGLDYRTQGQALAASPHNPQEADQKYAKIKPLDFMEQEETLHKDLKNILNKVITSSEPMNAEFFLDGLKNCASKIGMNVGAEMASAARRAYTLRQEGIRELREAQNKILNARRLFSEAMAANHEDRESRRLFENTGRLLANQVLPMSSQE